MPWSYLLECADGSLFAGSATDLDRRVAEHNFGRGSGYTKPRSRRPVKLVWSHEFESEEDAGAFARRIRGWGRATRLALVEGRLDDLPGLAARRTS